MNWLELVQNHFPQFFYVFSRTTIFVWLIPPFGMDIIPAQLRVAVSFVLTFVLCQAQGWQVIAFGHPLSFALFCIREIAVGGVLALVVLMVFAALWLAADLIQQQSGLDFSGGDEEEDQDTEPAIPTFVYLFGVTVFLLLNGHHTVIQLLRESLNLVPVGEMTLSANVLQGVVKLFHEVFVLGFQIAIPALFVFFVTSLIVMSASRGTREIGTYVLSLPVRVVVGWAAILLTLPIIVMVFQNQISGGFVLGFLK